VTTLSWKNTPSAARRSSAASATPSASGEARRALPPAHVRIDRLFSRSGDGPLLS
jgi:hypothetical protein